MLKRVGRSRSAPLLASILTAAALMLGGCGGGGSDGAAGPAGPSGATGPTGATVTDVGTLNSNSVAPTADAAAEFLARRPQITVQSVTVSGPPVVKFTVKDANGYAWAGLGSKAQSSTAIVASLTNLNFTLAKLVPGTNGSPSKWVSYIVTKPPTVAQAAGTVTASASCDSTTKPTVCGTYPSADTQGTLVDNGDGSYQYTFYRDIKQAGAQVASLIDSADGLSKKADLGDVSYDPTLTHRLGIFVAGSMPGTGTNTPNAVQTVPPVPLVFTANIGYDFVPAGGTPSVTRDIVVATSCDGCHDNVTLKKGIGHVSLSAPGNGIPAGSAVGRNDPRLCVSCHTDQTKYGFPEAKKTATGYDDTDSNGYKRVNGEAAFTYPRMIHQTHMGNQLVKSGYNLNAHAKKANGTTGCDATTNTNRGQCFNLVGFPQDQRNCTKCHDGSATKSDGSVNANKTTNGDNWKTVPSRLACGACHDGIDFATGTGITLANRDADVAAGKPVGTTATGHVGGAKADDALCALCHDSTSIPLYHQTTIASLNNPVVKAGVASFAYKISGVTINSAKQVVVKFQILKNGSSVALNAFAAGAVPLTGYTGGPTFQVAYATGQDGIAAPTDWNSGHDTLTLADAWAGVNGNSLSGPDATNTYTVTIAASSAGRSASHSLVLPADAKMVTALIAGAFTDPTVTANGGALPGVPAMVAATGNTPDGKPNVARRVIFSEAKCNNCHDRLGTSPNFHGGNYSIAMCPACHTPNQGGSTGWAASARVWVHGIHSASKRTVPFTWHAVSATDNYSVLQYPGVLKDCQQCHLPGTYDFSASQYTPDLIAGMLNVQAGTGKLNPASTTAYVFPQAAPVGSGQWAYGLKVDNTTDYGTGWSINPATGTLVAKTTQDSNLVTSPITAVCSTCHDATMATAHMEANGGSFYDPRSAAVTRTEQCLVCHGNGKVADISVVHKQ
jgi:OmcA/MtrC family decaheme c-type cytochrome